MGIKKTFSLREEDRVEDAINNPNYKLKKIEMRKVHKLIIKNPLKTTATNLVKYIYIQKIFSKVDWDSRILKTL